MSGLGASHGVPESLSGAWASERFISGFSLSQLAKTSTRQNLLTNHVRARLRVFTNVLNEKR